MMVSNAYALSEHFIDYPGRPRRVLPDAGAARTARALPALSGSGRLDLRRRAGRPGLRPPLRGTRAATAAPGPEVPHLPGACRPRRGARSRARGSLRPASARTRANATSCTARVACVQAHDGSHAAYIFDAPWADKLGFVEDAAATGLGPYRRYGRVVRTARDVGPLGAADLAGAQTRSILTELGYADDQVEAMLAAGCVGTPA